ncbi:hypothetical protein BDN72DRAFT_883895 [Pluteus cervinus]|uniref:Uncharacterized protein n=1 Tax=Pluteus cervinus TaxID=181527 RepID=A0ACD3A213_9AGAR|nr:hypothetical protein BDN72DRAFT_883895 [Pluteus cervinus]
MYLFCQPIDIDQRLLNPFVLEILPTAIMADLQAQIGETMKHTLKRMHLRIDAPDLQLWKLCVDCTTLSQEIIDIIFSDSPSERGNGIVQLLQPYNQVSAYWNESPKVASIALLVKLPAPSEDSLGPAKKRQRIDETQEDRDIEAARKAPRPSSAAVVGDFIDEQNKRPVLNGRPFNNFGPPIGLFHPVFNSFRAALTSQEPLYAAHRFSLILLLSESELRIKCYCPTIILAIAGPWLCVLGGIYLNQAVVRPLTDYIWLGGDIFNPNRLTSASRLFSALRSAILELEIYYNSIKSSPPIPITLTPDPFPFVRGYGSQTFTYLSRFKMRSDKLLYKAKLDESHRLVVVKFVSQYNARAHRLLAQHNLAPHLHYASLEDQSAPMYGGRYMIVMDFVDDESPMKSLSQEEFKQISQAIELLHSQDLVFGDLRRPNILIKGVCVMLIDFD